MGAKKEEHFISEGLNLNQAEIYEFFRFALQILKNTFEEAVQIFLKPFSW